MPIVEKHGKNPKDRRLRMTCSCGCVATFAKSEVQGDQRDGDYVVCPTCMSFVSVRSACVTEYEP